jgi:RNA recognition motif-containing protein
MAPFIVNVSGIASSTTEAQLHDFFTFCGQISSIQEQREKGTATIAFEKSSAAKTALMLDGGALDGSTLSVKSDVVHQDDHQPPHPHEHHIEQSDKPRCGIAAEYLAKGYSLSDHVLTRAIEIDNTQGISKRFLNYFQSLDKSVGHRTIGRGQTISGQFQASLDAATQHARGLDAQGGYSKSVHEYYSKAITSPLGQQVRNFYTSTSKQILDIHEEASRIASQQKEKAARDAAKPVELKASTAVSENPTTTPDAAKVSEATESKTDTTVVSGNPAA